MKISTNVIHEVTFSVQAFWDEEGGMGSDSFGKECNDINQALIQWDLANAHDPKTDWKIVCDVSKQVGAGKS